MGFRRLFLMMLVVGAFVLPGPVAAAGDDFTFTILKDTCQSTGGDFDHGHLFFKVRVDEKGASGADKFTLDAKVGHRSQNGARVTEYSWARFSATFPDDAKGYFHTRWFSYDPKDGAEHRIVVWIRVWHGQQLVAKHTLIGTTC